MVSVVSTVLVIILHALIHKMIFAVLGM